MKRPFTVTLLALGGLLLAVYNAFRAMVAAQQFELMQSLGVGIPAILLIVIGVTWTIYGYSMAFTDGGLRVVAIADMGPALDVDRHRRL